jgi:hypothetical protein|tara:strand:- start:233 stop:1630 length:1398 start_codon:yes stop_codon:yes gene_type:complete
MRIPGADKAIGNLIKWSAKEEWNPYWERLFAEHFDMICDRFDTTEEEIADLLGDAFGMVFGCVFEDFLTARFGDKGEKNVIDDYLKRRGWHEKVPAKCYLAALRDSVLSLYEVIDLDPGHRMTVRDSVLGGDPITVEEKLGSETAVLWDQIAGRIVTVNKKNYFTGSMLLFSQEVADEVLIGIDKMVKNIKKKLQKEAKKQGEPADFKDEDLREMLLNKSGARLFTRTWLIDALDRASGPLPEIRNTDGNEIVFSEARFPLTGEIAKVIAALDKINEFEKDEHNDLRWTWHGHGSPSKRMSREKGFAFETDDKAGRTILGGIEIGKGALILSTNSKERAEKGQNLLLSRLDGLVGRPLTSHQTFEKMLDERPDAPPMQSELPAEVAEQAIHSFLDNHYRQTLDEPLPILDGKTPRQAARTKKGRAQVISWIKKLENSEGRRAASQGQQPYDLQWMWQEMKIADPR